MRVLHFQSHKFQVLDYEQETAAYRRGRFDYHDGAGLDQCPFHGRPAEAEEWRDGWLDESESGFKTPIIPNQDREEILPDGRARSNLPVRTRRTPAYARV